MSAAVNHYPAYVPMARPDLMLSLADIAKWRGVYQRVLKTHIVAGSKNQQAIEDCEQHLALLDLAEQSLTRKAR